MDNRTPAELLEHWQKVLRLQDWDLELEIVHPEVLDAGTVAQATIRHNDKKAVIAIQRDAPDIEWEVLHELLECLLHTISKHVPSDQHWLVNWTINSLCRTLLGRNPRN